MSRTWITLLFAAMLFLVPADLWAQDELPNEAPVAEEVTEEAAPETPEGAVENPEPLSEGLEPVEEPEAEEPVEEVAPSTELEKPEEVLETLQLVIQAAKEGKWGLFAAGILMIGVWVLRRFFWTSLPKEYLPYITVGVAGVASFGAAVIAGTTVVDAIWVSLGGLMTGLAGVGFWEFIGKKLFKKADE